jgi:hypothetical protein
MTALVIRAIIPRMLTRTEPATAYNNTLDLSVR